MYFIENKVVAVTGGASGIGYAIAEKFLENGAKVVVILDIDDIKGIKAVDTLIAKYGANRSVFIHCDVRKNLEVSEKIINEYETVDVLVNSAGIVSDVVPENLININLTALINWTLKFKDHMNKENGKQGGTIVNISSIMGITPYYALPVYNASKYGVVGFSKSLGSTRTFNKTGVRVLTICPGCTKTDMRNIVPDDTKLKAISDSLQSYDHIWQEAEVVGSAVIDVFKKAKSGTVWVMDKGNLSEFITEDYVFNY